MIRQRERTKNKNLVVDIGSGLTRSQPASHHVPAPGRRSAGRFSLTPWQRRKAELWQRILERFTDCIAWGMSKAEAAQRLGVAYTSLWRRERAYKQFGFEGLIPATSKCGRKPAVSSLTIPSWIISAIQRLQGSGVGNERAWRILALDPRCPVELKKFIAARRTLPPSLLKLSRVQRRRVTEIKGNNFTMTVE
jgi:hypothetical protein